jgi:hypothetical protein
MMTLKTGDGYNGCKEQLHPTAKKQPRSYGPEGVMPNRHYTCYGYASVISAGPINTTVGLGQRTGDLWIYSAQKYANGSSDYTGTYSMQGNRIVASDVTASRTSARLASLTRQCEALVRVNSVRVG